MLQLPTEQKLLALHLHKDVWAIMLDWQHKWYFTILSPLTPQKDNGSQNKQEVSCIIELMSKCTTYLATNQENEEGDCSP